MVIVNTTTNIVHENATLTQASIIIDVNRKTISEWEKTVDVKNYNQFVLYFKVLSLKNI